MCIFFSFQINTTNEINQILTPLLKSTNICSGLDLYRFLS